MDAFGDHALTCPCGGDRVKRHNGLRNEAFFSLGSAGFCPELEKPGLLPPRDEEERVVSGLPAASSNRRPADVYVGRFRSDSPAALDFAATSGLRSDVLTHSARDGSVATQLYEDKKRNFLDTASLCSQEGFSFIPMVVESHAGGWGKEARKVFATMAQATAAASPVDTSTISDQLVQRLSCLLQRENARAVLCRLKGWASGLSPEGLAADALASAAS